MNKNFEQIVKELGIEKAKELLAEMESKPKTEEAYKWLVEQFNGCQIDIIKEEKNIYFKKDCKYLFCLDLKRNMFYYSWTNIYSILNDKFKLNELEFNSLVSRMLNEHTNWGSFTPPLYLYENSHS